jgi:hypothetical protein
MHSKTVRTAAASLVWRSAFSAGDALRRERVDFACRGAGEQERREVDGWMDGWMGWGGVGCGRESDEMLAHRASRDR